MSLAVNALGWMGIATLLSAYWLVSTQKATGNSRTINVALQRVSVVSSRPFDEIIQRLTGAIGRPDITAFHDDIVSATTVADLEKVTVVPDAAAYAPVTILVDERSDGVHLSYDSMASLLAPYGSLTALAIARDLDTRVVALLETVAHQRRRCAEETHVRTKRVVVLGAAIAWVACAT